MSPSRPTQPQQRTLLPAFATPSSSRTMRTLRKIQSHQVLTTSSSTGQTLLKSLGPRKVSGQDDNTHLGADIEAASRSRPKLERANSDRSGSGETGIDGESVRRPARKTGSGFGVRRPALEALLRDGPQSGDLTEGLQELRYLTLSSRVDADGDGMSGYRIYLWLALLDIPPLPTDEYLSLVHRGRSPAYAKIRNDTFRTLATDPLFKRRVTEASLIRLLNAVAWKLEDTKIKSPVLAARGSPTSRRRETERLVDPPPSIMEEELPGTASEVPVEGDTTSEKTKPPSINDSAIYVQGMNVLRAPFLYAARSEVEAFALFHYFITRECPGYIRGAMDGVHRGLRLVDRCLEIVEPKLAAHLFSKGLTAELYAFPSVLTLCACTPPLPEVLHLWDFLFAYGPHLNILCILAQLIQMRDLLLESPSPNKILRSFPPLDAKEIIALTVLIVRRIPDELYAELIDHAK